MILEKKADEERKLCSRVDDLELQLNKEKDDCQRSPISTKYFFFFLHISCCVLSREERIPNIWLYIILPFQFRMTSKTKKLIKAHGRYVKAKEDLKRQVFVTHISNMHDSVFF